METEGPSGGGGKLCSVTVALLPVCSCHYVFCASCLVYVWKMPGTELNNTSKRDVSPRVFQALQNFDVEKLSECTEEEIRAVMPCLARMSLITSLDQSAQCVQAKRMIFGILSGREIVNSIVGLLSIDFHALEVDVKKEQILRYHILVVRMALFIHLSFS